MIHALAPNVETIQWEGVNESDFSGIDLELKHWIDVSSVDFKLSGSGEVVKVPLDADDPDWDDIGYGHFEHDQLIKAGLVSAGTELGDYASAPIWIGFRLGMKADQLDRLLELTDRLANRSRSEGCVALGEPVVQSAAA